MKSELLEVESVGLRALDSLRESIGPAVPVHFRLRFFLRRLLPRRAGECRRLGHGYYAVIVDPTLPWADLSTVTLHEVAHAVDDTVYGRMGHTRTWRAMMMMLGADPSPVYRMRALASGLHAQPTSSGCT